LAMLHVGFAWLGISLALLAAAAATTLSSGGTIDLRLAGLHALGIGFFGSAQLAFVTRVSAGQAGRSQTADDIAWALFRALQAAVALRIAAVWRPDAAPLVLAAALLWAAVMLAWSVRYARWYGRPRVAGRPRRALRSTGRFDRARFRGHRDDPAPRGTPTQARPGLPGRFAARAQARRRRWRRRRLHGAEGRHQRAQLRGAELRPRPGARGRRVCPRARRTGADGAEHVRRRARAGALVARRRRRRRARRRRAD